MKRIAVIGHFGGGKTFLDGQTVKTKMFAAELKKTLGENEVLQIDTYGGVKALPKLFFQAISALKKSKNVLIMPAHNGVKFFAPVLSFFNRFYKRKLFYSVVGGWLPNYLQGKKGLEKRLKKFDALFVETQTMANALSEMGFTNVSVIPNCKELKILDKEELVFSSEPYGLCTFSRVMKEKGIEDAILAVKTVNERLGKTVYTLDIYGQVDAGQTEWFEDLKTTFPEYVNYCGLVDFDRSVEVLKDYFALLFPTRFATEGIPGTIIDAYAAGVPVVSAQWQSYGDIISDKTGIGYTLGNVEELTGILQDLAENPEKITCRKENCLSAAEKYLPSVALKGLIERLD